MELDVLRAYIASPPVATGLPVLTRPIAHKETPLGADIIVGIRARYLKNITLYHQHQRPPWK